MKKLSTGLLVTLTVIALLVSACAQIEIETPPAPASTPYGAELPPSSYLPEIPRISAEEVKAKSDTGINLVIIDSRSETSYARSHIEGAISIPLSTMVEPYSDLDDYDEIMTYCGWGDEQESARAVQKLIDAGYSNVKAVEGGFSALQEAGFRVAEIDHENQ